MRGMVNILISVLIAFPAFAAGGSNLGEYGKNFKPAVLTGKVTFDGTPVAGARVSTVAGHSTKTDANGDYTLRIDAPGGYSVKVKSGARTETRTTEVVLGQTTVLNITFSGTFSMNDVPAGSWAHDFVKAIYLAGITAGCSASPPLFCPDDTINRWQMAVFVETSLGASPAATCTGMFSDVNASTVGDLVCRYIEDFAARGITAGCGDGKYCPNDPVTRHQMAVFLEAALGRIPGQLPATCSGTFGDVNAGTVGALVCRIIEDFALQGITAGCSAAPPLFCPNAPVTRAQMAVFLVAAPLPLQP